MADYYSTCAFPKPGSKKKKLLHNGYKDKAARICAYCERPGADRHEVYAGNNRQISIRYGFQIDVCGEHHKEIQDNITEWAKEENRKLRRRFQLRYMKDCMDHDYMTAKQALTSWMQLIGKNYVEEFQP